MISFCMLFDATKGEFIQEARYTLPPKEALIAAVEQYKGNYNWWDYPKELEGIYKSNVIKDRLLYNITDDLIMYAQLA